MVPQEEKKQAKPEMKAARLLLKEPEKSADRDSGGGGAATNSLSSSSKCCYRKLHPATTHLPAKAQSECDRACHPRGSAPTASERHTQTISLLQRGTKNAHCAGAAHGPFWEESAPRTMKFLSSPTSPTLPLRRPRTSQSRQASDRVWEWVFWRARGREKESGITYANDPGQAFCFIISPR